MNKIVFNNGVHAPAIICDLCERPIEDARSGVAIFPVIEKQGEVVDLAFAHQGPCARTAAENLENLGYQAGTIDLMAYMRYLTFNLGLAPEDLEVIDEVSEQFGD